MTHNLHNGWTLHYTIGRECAGKVGAGDLVHLPGGRSDLLVVDGRAPLRARDCGAVLVRDPAKDTTEALEIRPGALGMVWISAVGGWSELP